MPGLPQGGHVNVGPVKTSRVFAQRTRSPFAPVEVSDGSSSAWPGSAPNRNAVQGAPPLANQGAGSLLAKLLGVGLDNESSAAPPSHNPLDMLVRSISRGFGGNEKDGTGSSYKFGPSVDRSSAPGSNTVDDSNSGMGSMPTHEPGKPPMREIDIMMMKMGMNPGPQKQADYEVNSQMAGRSQVPTRAEESSPDTLVGAGQSLLGNRGSNF